VPDDPSILNATQLFRRIVADWIVPDENRGCQRLSSAAFAPYSMSVALGDTLADAGRDPQSVLAHYEGQYLVSMTAGLARRHDQTLERSPRLEEPAEPAHGDVIGKKTRGCRRAFARCAEWTVGPDGVCDSLDDDDECCRESG
jgi:hypothetical protein